MGMYGTAIYVGSCNNCCSSQRRSDDLFTAWLVTLPRMLCQPFVSQHVLTTFACLARQQNRMFLQHLEEAVPDIIGKGTHGVNMYALPSI